MTPNFNYCHLFTYCGDSCLYGYVYQGTRGALFVAFQTLTSHMITSLYLYTLNHVTYIIYNFLMLSYLLVNYYSDLHAFQVLRSTNVTYHGYDFLALTVRVPSNGLSKSINWCYDYQYLCMEFGRRPTGCGGQWTRYSAYYDCRDKYYSDMNNGNVLGCDPASGVANVINIAYPKLRPPATYKNSFGFQQCQFCNKTIRDSEFAVSYMNDFWQYNALTFYTVCL